MIIYGRSSQKAVTGIKPGLCGNCDHDVEFIYQISNLYAHIYYIPTFPLGKSVAVVCPHCKAVSPDREISEEFKSEVKSFHKAQLNPPLHHYLGLAIIAGLLFYFSIFR